MQKQLEAVWADVCCFGAANPMRMNDARTAALFGLKIGREPDSVLDDIVHYILYLAACCFSHRDERCRVSAEPA